MEHKLFSSFTHALVFIINLFHFASPFPSAYSQLDYKFYDKSCPRLPMIVRYGVRTAIKNDTRMAASLLRLHFHDCFVNDVRESNLSFLQRVILRKVDANMGCDASVLLDDRIDLKGEKNAFPNRNSARGYEVIDNIKADVERACPSTVSCVDILALAAREAVAMVGGPSWPVALGRRDGLTASQQAANEQLPSPIEPLENITTKFTSKGLDLKDVVVLSGAHTIGYAQCFTFKRRLFDFKGSGKPDPTLDASALTNLQGLCPNTESSNANLAPLDTSTVYKFDNMYYTNLVNNVGLLDSDQALMADPKTSALVTSYSTNPYLFSNDFEASMMKLGNLGILTGNKGQIRKKCGSVN